FVKAFGCQIVEGNIPIDIAPFSRAILEGRPHPRLFLAFGPTGEAPSEPVVVGGSDVQVAMLDGTCAFATWFYEVGSLSVSVMYAMEGEHRRGLVEAWHPRNGHQCLVMARFSSEAPGAS